MPKASTPIPRIGKRRVSTSASAASAAFRPKRTAAFASRPSSPARPRRQGPGAAPGGSGIHARHAQAPRHAHVLSRGPRERRRPDPAARAGGAPRHADRAKERQARAALGHQSARQGRNGVFRLLSLALLFADEVCAERLSDASFLAAMARFEGALARAAARAGRVPAPLAELIWQVCSTARFDSAALAREGRGGTIAIALVRELTAQVAAVSPEAARHVHAGATSQDVIDSAAALCLKAGSSRLMQLAARLGDALAELARRHADTPTLARTLLQP